MEKRDLVVGDVVQISPTGNFKESFGGMLLVVTEPKSFGCQGYLCSCINFEAVRFSDRAFLRPTWEDMEYIGRLFWPSTEIDDDTDVL